MTIPRSFSRLKASPGFPWLAACFVGLSFILVAALTGVIQRFFNGEEFYVYQYAHNFTHMEAWQRFFFQNGRLIEGLYWTYQYEILGHSPLLAHSLSFVLLLIAALAAAACFLNAWPREKRSAALPYVFVSLFFINWITSSSVLRLSYDNTRLSMVFFFLAGLALQRWALSQRVRWLVLSFAVFLLSLLTYENAAFLFPALLLLAWPLLPASKKNGDKNTPRNRLILFVGLAAVSGLVILLPSSIYSSISQLFFQRVSTPVLEFELGEVFTHILSSGQDIYLNFGQFGIFRLGLLRILMVVGLLLTWALSTVSIVRQVRSSGDRQTLTRWVCIYLASVWFLIFGPLPYVLLGYTSEVGGRLYSSAIFGLFPMLFMIHQTAGGRWLRMLAAGLIALFAMFGALQLQAESDHFRRMEVTHNQFFLGLKQAVPNVRPNTLFIMINGPLGYVGCGPSLEMLYNKDDLDCALLFSSEPGFNTVRYAGGIKTAGLDLQGANWIVINVVDNVPGLIDELKPGQYDIPITWESTEPIFTNSSRLSDEPAALTEFYLSLLRRAQELAR